MWSTALEARGVKVAQNTHHHSTSVSVGGIPLSLGDEASTEYTFTLPRPPVPQLVFTRESFRAALSKLVWPEIQLGEPEFDDLVVARTTTDEATRAFLQDAEAKGFVLDLIAESGALTVEGAVVTVRVPSTAQTVDEVAVAAFVERLLR